jgi:hypothetical protein
LLVFRVGLPVAKPSAMNATFNAEEFVALIKQGELDGRLIDELRKLSDDELEEVVGVIVEERSKIPQLDEFTRCA